MRHLVDPLASSNDTVLAGKVYGVWFVCTRTVVQRVECLEQLFEYLIPLVFFYTSLPRDFKFVL